MKAEAREQTGRDRWRCKTCGQTFRYWTGPAGAQTHSRATGHHNIALL